jgi:hypothetical protein
MGAALAARLRSAGHTLATRQMIQLPGKLPRPGRSAFAAALRTRRGCRNEIKKALTSTSRDQAHTRPMATPGQRHVSAFSGTGTMHIYAR